MQLNGWMPQEIIARETYLPLRTLKYAQKKLREEEVIQKKLNPSDLRRRHYKIKGKLHLYRKE